jgi:hypothetical protein
MIHFQHAVAMRAHRRKAFEITRAVTTVLLNVPHPQRSPLLENARVVTEALPAGADEADVANGFHTGDVLLFPSGPLDDAGNLTISAADFLGSAPVQITALRMMDPNTEETGALRGQYALKVILSSDDAPNRVFGQKDTVVIVNEEDISTAVCMDRTLANILTGQPPQKGDTTSCTHHATSKGRQEFQETQRMLSFYNQEAYNEAFYPSITKASDRTASTISITSAIDWMQSKIDSIFNNSLTPQLALSSEAIRSVLLGKPIQVDDFTTKQHKQSSYSVDAVRAQLDTLCRVLRVIYKPQFVHAFQDMATVLINHLQTTDGKSVALAIGKQWMSASTYPLTRPDLTPMEAITGLWHIDAKSDLLRDINTSIVASRSADLEKKIDAMQTSTNTPDIGRRRRGRESDAKPNLGSTTPRASGAAETPFQGWVRQKPQAAKDIKPHLCAFADQCSNKAKCQFEHDITKIPEDQREGVNEWLAKRPLTTGYRLRKKQKVSP